MGSPEAGTTYFQAAAGSAGGDWAKSDWQEIASRKTARAKRVDIGPSQADFCDEDRDRFRF
jgi:hypothetical protein